jgi:hypothetical protein
VSAEHSLNCWPHEKNDVMCRHLHCVSFLTLQYTILQIQQRELHGLHCLYHARFCWNFRERAVQSKQTVMDATNHGPPSFRHLPLMLSLPYRIAGCDDLYSPTVALTRYVQLVPPLHPLSISSPAASRGRCDCKYLEVKLRLPWSASHLRDDRCLP